MPYFVTLPEDLLWVVVVVVVVFLVAIIKSSKNLNFVRFYIFARLDFRQRGNIEIYTVNFVKFF